MSKGTSMGLSPSLCPLDGQPCPALRCATGCEMKPAVERASAKWSDVEILTRARSARARSLQDGADGQ